MDYEAGRVALATKIKQLADAWTAYTLVVEYDNRTVDPAAQVNPYLCVSLDFKDGYQADLSARPFHRALGVISLEVVVKAGSGRKLADELLEYFVDALQMKDTMPPLRTRAAVPLTMLKDKEKNLARFPTAIPFWMDSAT